MPERRTAAQWQEVCERLAYRRDAEVADLHWLDTQLLQALRSGSWGVGRLLRNSIAMAKERVERAEAELDAARAARDAAIIDPDAPLLHVFAAEDGDDLERLLWGHPR